MAKERGLQERFPNRDSKLKALRASKAPKQRRRLRALRKLRRRCLQGSALALALVASPLWASLCRARTLAEPSARGIAPTRARSEEHTSELQSLRHLVCRLLLEK